MPDKSTDRIATPEERRAGLDCLRCGSVVQSEGTWALRTGGASGGVTALFGALAELSENTIDVLVSSCPVCGHLEFRASTRA